MYYKESKTRDKSKGGTLVTESLLNFVDLAGSEKVSNHYRNRK